MFEGEKKPTFSKITKWTFHLCVIDQNWIIDSYADP